MLSKIKSYFYNEQAEQFSYAKLCLGMLLLLVCGLRLIRHFNTMVDISFDDEVKYMRYGLDLFENIRNDWGPTYNMWYKFLSLFEQRPVELYLLNYKVVVLLTAITFFTFLYCYGISFATSLWVSLCLLVSNVNIVNYPRISQVVVCFFLWSIVINKLWIVSKSKQYLLICFALFVGAFARPELMLAFLLFFFFTIYFIWKTKTIKEVWVFAVPLVAVMVLLLYIVQLPANTYMGKDRLYGVFCQHYTVKYIYTNKTDYALFIDWMDFSKKQFPGCNTFVDILKHYPMVVVSGMLTNIKIFLLVMVSSLSEIFYPKYIYYKKTLEAAALLVPFIILTAGWISKEHRKRIGQQITAKKEILLLLLIFALPGFASAVVFFPRPHYLLFLLIPLILVLSVFIDILFSSPKIKLAWLTLLIVLFIYRMPSMNNYKTPRIISGKCPNQSYKNFIQTLNRNSDKPHVIFSNILNLSMMTDKNFTDFSAEQDYNNQKSFIQQMTEKKVDYILVTDFLLQDRRLRKDSTWQQLIANPQQYGFTKKMLFKDCATYLLYKE